MKCRVCLCALEPDEDDLCGRCAGLAALVRERLEAVDRKRKPPKKTGPPCRYCGTPMKPVLFRPDAKWTWYCAMGCHWCNGCRRVVRYDQTCPCWHCARCTRIDPRTRRSLRPIPNGQPCPMCGARQSAATLQ